MRPPMPLPRKFGKRNCFMLLHTSLKQNLAPDALSEAMARAHILPKAAQEKKGQANFKMLVCASLGQQSPSGKG